MTRPERSEGLLRRGAEAIAYEFAQLLESAELGLRAEGESVIDEPLGNAALESLLIHVRNLRCFLLSEGYRDDIMARDFLDEDLNISLPTVGADETWTRLNKQLAHPDYHRYQLPKKWPVGKMVQELVSAMARFLEQLGRERPERREWFADAADRIRRFQVVDVASDLSTGS